MSLVAEDANGKALGAPVALAFGTNDYIEVPNTGVSTPSSVFATGVTLIRVAIELDGKHVHFKIGDATSTCNALTDPFIPVGTVEFFAVPEGGRISFAHSHTSSIKVCVTQILPG